MGDDDPRLHAMNARRLPYVLIDHDRDDAALTVGIDDRAAARATVEHLIGLGHRRFGAVMGWDVPVPTAQEALAGMAYYVARERLGGWRDAVEAAGLDWESVPVASANGFGHETGRIAGGKLLDRAERPTAIVCMSDVLAIGVLAAAGERDLAVPEQLSVTGFDDVPEAAAAGLTTVRQPHQEKGAEALRLLLGDAKQSSVLLPTELILRQTTSPSPT
jgi:DNA-binding LacI/PurR family transcriptional regulator